MSPRRRSNPLALAILTVLQEGDRHPYDIAATLKARHKHESIRLNYGALYSVVEKLREDGFVDVVDTVRDGRRPQRTIYGITDAGLAEMVDWLADLVSTPQKEYGQFEAALSLLPSLPPEDALLLLDARLAAIDLQLARFRAGRMVFRDELGLPRVFALEVDYVEALLRAERAYVAELIGELTKGTLEGLGLWRRFYEDEDGFAAGNESYDPDWRALDEPPIPVELDRPPPIARADPPPDR